MAGVDLINSVRKIPFQDEVRNYIATCALYQGVTYLPDPLDFAQRDLSEPRYICMDCGNIDDDDDLSDGQCDVCTGRFADDHPLNGAPASGHEKDGKNIKKFVKRSPEAAEKQFKIWKGSTELDIDDENPAHVQAGKLVVGHRYMLLRRQQLVDQLEELKQWVST